MPIQYDTIVSQGKTFSFPKGLLQAMPLYNAIYNDYLNQPQCNIVWDDAPFKIVQGVRQSGKTHIIKALAMLHALMCWGKTILITANTHQMAHRINEDIKTLYNSLPEPKPRATSWNQMYIDFDNGSRIVTCIANCCSGRGLTIDMLLMDEVAFYNEKELKLFWESNFPLIKGMGREIVIVSTRKNRSMKTNFFWKTWIGAQDGKNGFKPFTISNKDCPHKDKKQVKAWKNILGRAAYDREHTIRTK